MIYQLNIPRRSPFTARVTEAFLAAYGKVFTLVSAEDCIDPSHPTVRLACNLRPGAIFLNFPPITLVATDGLRFEFEIDEAEANALLSPPVLEIGV